MDPVQMLKEDHQKVRQLKQQFEHAGSPSEKRKIAEQALHELEIHAALEEEIFYPAVAATANKDGKELVAEGIEEHHVVDVLINELKALEPEDEQFDDKFKVLTENVEHHIEEEEGEMLPDAEKKLGREVEQLGERMQQRREELLVRLGSRV